MIGRGRRLLVVEDKALTAALLADSLRAQGFAVEVAGTVDKALQAVSAFDPDAVLIDVNLGDGPSGIDLGQRLDAERPDVALIYLTDHPDLRTAGLAEPEISERCGFLNKTQIPSVEYLAMAIDVVLTGGGGLVRHDRNPSRPLSDLSARQIEVLRLIALGWTNERIAQAKGVTLHSVERWIKELFELIDIKTNSDVNPRAEATRAFIAAAGVPSQ